MKNLLLKLGLDEKDIHLTPHKLSGGMKQRVSLARAILRPSKILLLDEPTKELDDDNIETVLSIIKKEAENRVVILVTHRIDDIRKMDAEIVVLKSHHK